MSERRACRVIDADRKSMRYRSQRGDDDELRSKLRELAQQRRRFGYLSPEQFEKNVVADVLSAEEALICDGAAQPGSVGSVASANEGPSMDDANETASRNDAKRPWSTPLLRDLSVDEVERMAPGWAKQFCRRQPDKASPLHELSPVEAARIARLFARG